MFREFHCKIRVSRTGQLFTVMDLGMTLVASTVSAGNSCAIRIKKFISLKTYFSEQLSTDVSIMMYFKISSAYPRSEHLPQRSVRPDTGQT